MILLSRVARARGVRAGLGVLVAIVVIAAANTAYALPNASVPNQNFGEVRVANAATTTVTRTFLTYVTPPNINLVTTSVAFGNVTINPTTPPTRTVTIGNTGDQTLTFTASVGATPFSSLYTLSGCFNNCSVNAGATASFTMTFNPTQRTDPDANVTLSVASNDPDNAIATIPVTGRGVAPRINTPAPIAFGDVVVNTTPAPVRTVTINNTGNVNLVFTAAKVTSTFSGLYTLGGCFNNCSVTPGSSANFTVTFNPTSPTNPNADITINLSHNDPEKITPLTIAVTGRGTAPQINTPAPLAFGNVEVGAMSATQDLVVTNTGNADLVISNASLTTGGTDYVVMAGTTGSQMTTVPPGMSTSWSIVCTPQDLGSRPGNFRIVSNSFTQSTVNVALSCTGLKGVLDITGSPINFGNVAIGTVVTNTFTLRNIGNLPVTNIAAAVNPPNVGYSIDPTGNPVPTMLAAGASVILTVRFAPTLTTDGGTATITFTGEWGTTAKPTSAVLQLSGTPRTADYSLSTMMVDFGNLRFDATLDRTFCIVNTGQISVTIVNPIDIAPAAGTVTGEFSVVRIRKPATCGGTSTTNLTLPQTLAATELLEVTVRADPANRTGLMQAALTVNSNLPTNPTRSLTLRANSTTGAFSLSPGSMIDFGAVDVQGAAVSSSFTITNTGTGPLDLTTFARTADPEFAITLPPNTTLGQAQSVSIPVTYKPVVASPAGSEERVNVTHAIVGDVDGPASQTLVLQGRGIDRVLNFAATPTFPPTFRNPGADAPVRTVTIKNLGEAPLKVSAAMIGDISGAWQLLNAPTTTLTIAKDTTVDFMVRFSPIAAGLSQAKLVITNDDSDRPMASVDLVGMGIDRNVQFGPMGTDEINIGYTGVGVPVTIEGALVVTSMDMTNTFTIRDIDLDQDNLFRIEGFTPGLELAPGAERTFGITFTSQKEGEFTAEARLYLDEDLVEQRTIRITGKAVFVDTHGGGGCATGGSRGAAGTAGLVLAALLGLRRWRPGLRRRTVAAAATAAAVLAAALLLLAPAAASAEDIVLSVFDPAPATVSNGFQLQSPEVGKSGDWAMSAVLSHATEPLTLDWSLDGTPNSYATVTRSTAANVGAAFAFLGRFEAGARMPFYLQDGQAPRDPLIGFASRPAEGNARGDLALHAKWQLTKQRLEGGGAFVAGLVGQVTLPTATRDQFAGVEDPSGRVLLLGSLLPGAFEKRITLTMNLGGVLRAPARYANVEQKSGIAWGLGLQVRALDPLWLAAEIYGDLVPAGRAERTDAMGPSHVLSPIEWLGGLRWKPDRRVTVGVAVGRGLTSAVGTPAFRGVFSLTVTPGASEVQRPVRLARPLQQPQQPRRRPPRPIDTDRDGIADGKDRCVNEAEDKNGIADGDGCPDNDADRDGLIDARDRCPRKAEDKDGFQDQDGCPDGDNDGDGIADRKDRCVNEAEDRNGIADGDGCPDGDADRDGIVDVRDKCPQKAEDRDGFQDQDGCPDLDNDGDGLADAQDKCPLKAETINGNQDDDGCPDEGGDPAALAAVAPGQSPEQAAEATFKRGRELMQEKKYFAACTAFEQSQRLDPRAGTQYNLALCYAEIGKLASALNLHRELVRYDKNVERRQKSDDLTIQLAVRAPKIKLSLVGTPADVSVFMNGTNVNALIGIESPIDFGTYTLVAGAPGYRGWRKTVEVKQEGELVTVDIDLGPPVKP